MAKHSILIVDHQHTVLGLAKKVLADDGYEVHVAGSSREAIDLSRGLGPELLVINPAMPTLSGVEAARQISRDAKCKVLFLSDLAKDSDFREMLRGLRQQGCECSAIGVPFESSELLTYVRREIGSVVVATQHGELPSPTPPPARAAAAAAPARAPLPDYQPLLEMVGPQLYERNAFRVTALGVDASLRDISRQAEKLEMMAKLGVSGIAKELFSTAPATAEEIRAALLCLKTPDKRLLHEFFWFWPTNRQSETDPAVDAIKVGDVRKAEEVWNLLAVKQQELTSVSAQLDSSDVEPRPLLQKKQDLEHAAAVSIHNLAILYHIQALTLESKTGSRLATDDANRIAAWTQSFNYWSRLRNQHGFWEVLVDRIRSLNDPRLGVETAEMIWASLPLALLSVNAQFAATAAEARNFEEAGLHRRLMILSGLGDSCVRDALCRGLKPLQQEFTRLCETAEKDSLQLPDKALEIVRKLLEDKKKYLQTFNYLLGNGDPLRDSLHDLLAQSARSSLVAYANKTENWEQVLPVFEECLALAESKSLRSRFEDDIDMLTGNAAAQRAARRTQATAAPPRQTPPQQQGARNTSTASPTRPNRPTWLIIAAVIGVGILIIIGTVNGPQSSHVPSTAPSSSASSSFTASPAATSEPYPSGGQTNTTELESLRRTIDGNSTTLRQMKNTLSDLDSQMATLNSQIEADEASLKQMTRDHDLGSQVDINLYEVTRQRHNSAVKEYNSLVNTHNSSLLEYKSLLTETNSDIDRYNALVRSQ
jgi:CheY-like chemotaxis protein